MRTWAVALAATLLPIGLAGPAAAEKVTFRDAKGDVVALYGPNCPGPCTPTPLPDSPLAHRLDIKRLTVNYRHPELRLTTVARLYEDNSLPDWIDARWRLKGADGQDWDVLLFNRGQPFTAVLSHEGQEQPCTGLVGKVIVPRKAWRVVIPARCLGKPSWVRAGGQLTSVEHTSFTNRIDDALTTEPEDTRLRPRLGRKVHRG
jgi:hypothetical protein